MQWNAQEWISRCAIIAAQIRKSPPMRVICIVSKRENVGPSEPTQDLQKCKKSNRPAAPANNRHEIQSASATPLPHLCCCLACSLAYTWLTKTRRRLMREIRANAAARGWRYGWRRWQGDPISFRIDGET